MSGKSGEYFTGGKTRSESKRSWTFNDVTLAEYFHSHRKAFLGFFEDEENFSRKIFFPLFTRTELG